MNFKLLSRLAMAVLMTASMLLSTGLVFAEKSNNQPMKPELAAKKEMVRKQHEQRVTDPKRKTAADALKAERIKVYQAKQHVKKSEPKNSEAK